MEPDLRQQAGPHVFVRDLNTLEITDDDRHHLAKSLRLREGDPLTASDAAGSWRTVSFGSILQPTGEIHAVAAPKYDVGLGIALTKSTKPEFVVQKATELGVDRIVLFPAAHSVVQWDDHKRQKNLLRLERVAREAAMQSHRVRIPQVDIVDSLTAVAADRQVARADFGGVVPTSDHRFVLIGPEGGWSESERTLVPKAVDLGPTVLRAETAAVVAATLMVRSRERSD